MSGWINVKDHLPWDGVEVLVFPGPFSRSTRLGEYYKGYWIVDGEDYASVEFWQPKPANPKEEFEVVEDFNQNY